MTWTNQGLALRKALEAAIERAQPTGGMRHGHESIRVAELRSILAAHPVDEGPLNVTVIIDDSAVRFRAALLADMDRATGRTPDAPR